MLIDDDLYRWTQIGIGFAIPAILLIWAIRKGRFKLGMGLAVVAFFGFLTAASIFTGTEATPALRVAPGGRIAKAVVLGSTRYHFANGIETTIAAAGKQIILVINDTDKPMAIMPIRYSVGGWGSQDTIPSEIIAPFSTFTTNHDIDYYGQGAHAPPHTVQVQSIAPQVTLHWLTDVPR